jgi:RNA polymerase sigma-70 factor (ECF subfamily)
MNQPYSEAEIIAGCISGERKFQQALYNLLSGKMFAVCLRYANDYSSAQDLLQEGFVKARVRLRAGCAVFLLTPLLNITASR